MANTGLIRLCMFIDQHDRCLHIAVTTTTIRSVCPKCGITKRSGKISCCGRGGSWFGNCGSTINTKVDHTWHEGLQVCKARSQPKTVIREQLKEARQQDDDSSLSPGEADHNYKAVIKASESFSSTRAPIPCASSVIEAAHAPANISTACNTITIKSGAISELDTTTTTPLPSNIARTIMAAITPNITAVNELKTTSVHVLISPHSTDVMATTSTSGHARDDSQGCEIALDIAASIGVLLTVVLLSC